jgi:hypothetical protein
LSIVVKYFAFVPQLFKEGVMHQLLVRKVYVTFEIWTIYTAGRLNKNTPTLSSEAGRFRMIHKHIANYLLGEAGLSRSQAKVIIFPIPFGISYLIKKANHFHHLSLEYKKKSIQKWNIRMC